jgi:hypothetical protein
MHVKHIDDPLKQNLSPGLRVEIVHRFSDWCVAWYQEEYQRRKGFIRPELD